MLDGQLAHCLQFAIAAFCITSGLARHLIMTPQMRVYETRIQQALELSGPSPKYFYTEVRGEPPVGIDGQTKLMYQHEFTHFVVCLFAALLDDADLDLRPAYNFFNSLMLPWHERFCK